MRAARLLQILLLLQNRGRMTSAELAAEVEVTPRTILRDVDAMTEAGLPIIVHRGNAGGIELGFKYRTRLTGLASDEAEAMAVILSYPLSELAELGMEHAANRARSKLLESFPDVVREKMSRAKERFQFEKQVGVSCDIRIEALVRAIRNSNYVRINAGSRRLRTICPVALVRSHDGWSVLDQDNKDKPIALAECGDINISARRFSTSGQSA